MQKHLTYIRDVCVGLVCVLVCVTVESAFIIAPAPANHLAAAVVPQSGVLSAGDAARYREAFALDHAHNFAAADAVLVAVSDPMLKPELLAERYESEAYKASYTELAVWLSHYADYPEAPAIYRLALARKPAGDSVLAAPQANPGTEQHVSQDRSVLREAPHWQHGLAAYRRGDMIGAAQHFAALLKQNPDLPTADRATVAFWAYRALLAGGETREAMDYVTYAAQQPPSFYSLLARTVTEDPSPSVMLRQVKVAPLLRNLAVRRAIALKEIGQDSLAENELTALFSTSGEDTRERLFTLASLLNLPGAEMRMVLEVASQSGSPGDTLYPIPRWSPSSGYRIEPALLFAIMRQESGFDPHARSRAGALGVMQVMPATARSLMHAEHPAESAMSPAYGMALGQSYLKSLMDTPSVGDNLVMLTAAYNAGPGAVANWRKNLRCESDPLLFIESVPYNETRQYIVNVMGNYWVYARLLGSSETTSLSALVRGDWPRYSGVSTELTAMVSRLNID